METRFEIEKLEKKAKRKTKMLYTVTYLLLTGWALIVLFPFYFMVLTSVKSYGSYNAEFVPKLYTLSPTFQNYIDAFTTAPLSLIHI